MKRSKLRNCGKRFGAGK